MSSTASTITVSGSRPSDRFRFDIEGLRAVAVVLVVLDHALGWPRGGFIGVDVFYVISGYLITGLLLREHARSGWISFTGFYARRARRILPAAVAVLLVTVAVAFIVWHVPRALQTTLDAVASMLFVENWHLIVTGADYLQGGGAVSPLQHYWSLSVEEQFYVVWPVLVLIAVEVLRRVGRSRNSRAVLCAVIGMGIAASLVWVAVRTAGAPTVAYFDSFGRAWELLLGAFVAVIGTAGSRSTPALRAFVSSTGLVMIVVGSVLITPDVAFPFPWVIVPVLGTALIIWSAADRGGLLPVLTNPVARYLGRISYSFYLWHFPVIIFGEAIFGDSLPVAIVCVLVSVGISSLSYHFIEIPVQRGTWLSSWQRPVRSRRAAVGGLAVALFIGLVITGFAVAQFRGPVALRNAAELQETFGGGVAIGEVEPAAAGTLPAAVAASLSATAWPALTPDLDDLTSNQQGIAMSTTQGCRNSVDSAGPPRTCAFGPSSAGMTIAVVGDSIALSWLPTVVAAYPEARVVALGYADCALIDVPTNKRLHDPAFPAACARKRQEMLSFLETARPELVFLSSGEGAFGRLESGATGGAATSEWQTGLARSLEAVEPMTDRVVVIGAPPLGVDLEVCATRWSAPSACVSELTDDYRAKATAEEEAVATVGGGAGFVDTRDWFCVDDRCPAFIDGVTLRTDIAHLTAAAGVLMSGTLRAEIGPGSP